MIFARYSKGETFSFLLLSSGGRTNQIASNLLFLLLARHSLQAASALASCVGSNLRPPGYEPDELPTARPRDTFASAKVVVFSNSAKFFALLVRDNRRPQP